MLTSTFTEPPSPLVNNCQTFQTPYFVDIINGRPLKEKQYKFYSILFMDLYSSLFYLWTYKAPLAVQPNQKRFQCEGLLKKRKVLRERAETVVPPDNITARVKALLFLSSRSP